MPGQERTAQMSVLSFPLGRKQGKVHLRLDNGYGRKKDGNVVFGVLKGIN